MKICVSLPVFSLKRHWCFLFGLRLLFKPSTGNSISQECICLRKSESRWVLQNKMNDQIRLFMDQNTSFVAWPAAAHRPSHSAFWVTWFVGNHCVQCPKVHFCLWWFPVQTPHLFGQSFRPLWSGWMTVSHLVLISGLWITDLFLFICLLQTKLTRKGRWEHLFTF